MLSTTAITTLNLLIGEDVVDHIVNVHFVTDGGSNYAEIIDELLKNFPCLAFREDWMQGPDVIPEQSLRHGEGNGSTSVDPMKPSGHGWGCPASGGNGVAMSIHRLAVAAASRRAWTCDSKTDVGKGVSQKSILYQKRVFQSAMKNSPAILASAATSWARMASVSVLSS